MPPKPKKSKKTPTEPDPEEAPDPVVEEEEEPEPDADNEEPVDDDADDEVDGGEDKKERLKKKRAVARRRGYRHLATKGGYSTSIDRTDASRDVTKNVVSVKETIRACKWAPTLADKVAFDNIAEFRERVELANEALPAGPAAVYRASGEVFLRKIVNEAVQRTFEAGKTRVTVATMASVLRPIVPLLKYNFATPQGLVRHAQNTLVARRLTKKEKAKGIPAEQPAIATFESDEQSMQKDARTVAKQIEFKKLKDKEAADKAKLRAAKRAKPREEEGQPADPEPRKKKARVPKA